MLFVIFFKSGPPNFDSGHRKLSLGWYIMELFHIQEPIFTASESGNKSEKDKRINGKHQRKFSRSLTLGLNTALVCISILIKNVLIFFYSGRTGMPQ